MGFPSWKYDTSTAEIVYLHLLLWGAMITFVLALYLFAVGASDQVLVPCPVLLIIATSASLAYVGFHERNARKRTMLVRTKQNYSAVRRPVYIATRLLIALAMLWLLSSGWNMIIAARQPICLTSSPMLGLWQAGGPCRAQRTGAAFSILNLLTACALFTHMATTRDPFGTRLMGKVRDRPTTVTPYRFSTTFRLSKDRNLLGHKRNASSEMWPEKPLPKTPEQVTRTPTPALEIADPIGLSIQDPVNLPVSPPMNQRPIKPPTRPASAYRSPHSPTLHRNSRTPSMQQHRQSRPTNLPGFTPTKAIRRPASTGMADSAWQAVHPPANQFRHVPSALDSLHSHPPQDLATIKAVPVLDLSIQHSPSIRCGSAFPYARGHTRNKSAPYPPAIAIPPKSPSSHTSSAPSPRKRGHVRCTSDPNEMISAHLAAEMDLAMRLDRKLQEVSQKLEAQKSAEKNQAATVTVASASEFGDTSTESALSSSSRGVSRTGTTTTGVRKARSDLDIKDKDKLFAKMEWDMLMGKEMSALD